MSSTKRLYRKISPRHPRQPRAGGGADWLSGACSAGQRPPMAEALSFLGELIAAALPPAGAPAAEQQAAIAAIALRLRVRHHHVRFPAGWAFVNGGEPLEAPSDKGDICSSTARTARNGRWRSPTEGWFAARAGDGQREPLSYWLLFLGISFALALSASPAYPAGAWPTRRLIEFFVWGRDAGRG